MTTVASAGAYLRQHLPTDGVHRRRIAKARPRRQNMSRLRVVFGDSSMVGRYKRGVSANLLYGFGQIILQSHRRDAVEARGALAAEVVIGGREGHPLPRASDAQHPSQPRADGWGRARGGCSGVSANLLYGFGHIILQNSRIEGLSLIWRQGDTEIPPAGASMDRCCEGRRSPCPPHPSPAARDGRLESDGRCGGCLPPADDSLLSECSKGATMVSSMALQNDVGSWPHLVK
jgi:hypothetical protein